MNSRLMPFQN